MFPLWFPNPFFELACFTNRALQSFDLFIPTSWTNLMWLFFKTNVSIKMQFFGKNTDTEYWYFSFFLVLILIMFSVFFMVNTDIDTSVFKICTEYWILVFLFCTGHFSASKFEVQTVHIETKDNLYVFTKVRQVHLLEYFVNVTIWYKLWII